MDFPNNILIRRIWSLLTVSTKNSNCNTIHKIYRTYFCLKPKKLKILFQSKI